MVNETIERVVSCLAAATRYPAQLLTPDADLENDLGIDSVKLVEIVIALSTEFGVELQNEQRDPSMRTIDQIANWIDGMLASANTDPVAPQATDLHPQSTNGHHRTDAVSPVAPPSPSTPTPHFPVNGLRQEAAASAKPLDGRVALVTGSGRGIGRTIARILADRGATVLVNSFHSRDRGEQTVADIQAQGGKAIHLWGSVAHPDHVDQLFGEIETNYGLDILICNASDGRIGPFLDLTGDDWDRAFRTNVSGHHQCAVRAAKLMRARGGGSIVTMSAVGAHQYVDGLGCQGVVKAAVESLTRYLACELGRFGIRVNCIAGGPVYGDLLSKFPGAEATLAHWESLSPDGELCSPMDIAQTIAFLVSDAARGINGAVWTVDHGYSANADGPPQHRIARNMVRPPDSYAVPVD